MPKSKIKKEYVNVLKQVLATIKQAKAMGAKGVPGDEEVLQWAIDNLEPKEKLKKDVRAYLNSKAKFEMDNVPYIKLANTKNPEHIIWLNQPVEDFLVDLVLKFSKTE